jgi:hypothetical protein
VSMKHKLTAALTSAGLLAGIFGSALAPSVLAAGRVGSGAVPVLAKTVITTGTNIDTTVASASTLTKSLYWSLVDDGTPTQATTASNDQGWIEFSIADADNVDITSLQTLVATSSSSLVRVAWMYDSAGAAEPDCTDMEVANGGTFNSASWTTSDRVEGVDNNGGGGDYVLCVRSSGTPGAATITVVANGVTLPVVTLTTLGDLASLTFAVREGYNYVAEENAEVNGFFTVIGRDAAGQVLNGPANGVAPWELESYFSITEDPDNADRTGGNVADVSFFTNDGESDGATNIAYTWYDLDASMCLDETYSGANDADAGKVYSLGIEGTAVGGQKISSNAVSLTCTGPGDKAKAGAITAESAGGGLIYDETGASVDDRLGIYVAVTDAAGRPMGVGSGTIDFDISFVGSASLGFVDNGPQAVSTAGKLMVAYLMPNLPMAAKYPYTIKLNNSDLGAVTPVLKSAVFTYLAVDANFMIYPLTLVKNSSWTIATFTVNFGLACSNQRVEWVVERLSGAVASYFRRANIDGVAKLTLERRKTKVWVYALCNSGAMESEVRRATFR